METSGQTFTLYNLLCLIIAITPLAIKYIPPLIKKLNKNKYFVVTTFEKLKEIISIFNDTIIRSETTSFNEGTRLFLKCKCDVNIICSNLIAKFETKRGSSPALAQYKNLSLDFIKCIKCSLEDHNCFCSSNLKANSIYDICKNADIIPDYKLNKTLLQIKKEVTNYHLKRIFQKWEELNALANQSNS
ncbi:MAG: hypothetical protein IJB65_05660 [Clostridia bacterium]|nr:hypothetical protein [Clostridia bacterium]